MKVGPILVVDDDSSILDTITAILELEGYPVTTAINGLEALRSIELVPPSLVLLDMRMPVMDGWGFVHELESRGVQLPIVVMTAARDAQRWATEIGAAGFLAKPFELSNLLSTVERLLDGVPEN